jgi:hypothetical protein
MTRKFLIFVYSVIFLAGCATPNKHLLKIETTPSDALVSVHETKEAAAGGIRKVAGGTPVEKLFDFPETNRLWLEVEKRGYRPQIIEVSPETKALSLQLERAKDKEGKDLKEYSVPPVHRILMAEPDFKVIRRGFSKEQVSEQETNSAQTGLTAAAHGRLSGKYEISTFPANPEAELLMKSIWRDARTAMEFVDPVRLKYLPAHYLETKSSREAARQLGLRYKVEALLLLSGKQNLETAGMKIGKLGITTAGTAVSYAGGYANAVANNESYFAYTIYVPQFAEGTLVRALLIDCSNGEVLWANRGLWGPFRLDDAESVKTIAADLFAGL